MSISDYELYLAATKALGIQLSMEERCKVSLNLKYQNALTPRAGFPLRYTWHFKDLYGFQIYAGLSGAH